MIAAKRTYLPTYLPTYLVLRVMLDPGLEVLQHSDVDYLPTYLPTYLPPVAQSKALIAPHSPTCLPTYLPTYLVLRVMFDPGLEVLQGSDRVELVDVTDTQSEEGG